MLRSASAAIAAVMWPILLGVGALALPASAGATVSGRVTDHRTGQPLGGMRLGIWYPIALFPHNEIGSATTAADGSYSWPGVCPLTNPLTPCHISVEDERYLYADVLFGNADGVVADFALVPVSTISGDIRVDGAPPAGPFRVRVEYLSASGQTWYPVAPLSYREDAGHYVVDRLGPDIHYRLCAGGAEYQTVEQCFRFHDRTSFSTAPPYDEVILDEGEHREGADFALSSGGGVEGTLHDGYLGAPLAHAGAEIQIYDAAGVAATGFRTTSDANGHYRVTGLPDGSYYIGVSVDGPFTDARQIFPGIVCENGECPPATNGQRFDVSGGSSAHSVDFTVHPQSVFKGRVTDATNGQGLQGIEIWTSALAFEPSTTTNADGDFAFYMRAGNFAFPFKVFAHHGQPYIDQSYPGAPCTFGTCGSVGEGFRPAVGDVFEHVDFALQQGAAVSGTIVDAATGLPPPPGTSTTVVLYDSAFHPIWSGSADEHGRYRSDAWYAGTYYVAVGSPFDCVYYDAVRCPFSDQDITAISPTPLTVGTGEIRDGIDLHVRQEVILRNGFGFAF
jgi:hypothetical protein